MKDKKLNLEDLDQVTGGVTCNAVKDVNIPGTEPLDDDATNIEDEHFVVARFRDGGE